MNNTTAPENKTTTSEAKSTQTNTNEEILTLLRKLVEENTAKAPQTTEQREPKVPQKPAHTPQENVGDSDVKRLLEELLKAKTAPADIEVNDEEDATDDDNEFEGEFLWNPAPEWEPVAYAAGGAALVGLGALLYHLLKD